MNRFPEEPGRAGVQALPRFSYSGRSADLCAHCIDGQRPLERIRLVDGSDIGFSLSLRAHFSRRCRPARAGRRAPNEHHTPATSDGGSATDHDFVIWTSDRNTLGIQVARGGPIADNVDIRDTGTWMSRRPLTSCGPSGPRLPLAPGKPCDPADLQAQRFGRALVSLWSPRSLRPFDFESDRHDRVRQRSVAAGNDQRILVLRSCRP